LTFFGERRAHAVLPADSPDHGAMPGHGHGHGHGLHDAPPAMAIVLIVLAIGSVVAGFIGVPHALGGHNVIEGFLEPSFHAPGLHAAAETAPAAEASHANTTLELGLMLFSVLVAAAGIGLATMIYLRKPELASAWAARVSGAYRLLLNKYYVDEVYDAIVVQPIKRVSSVLLWRGIDAGLIDGTVNAVGLAVRGWSAVLRRLQTGSVRAYAMSLFVGVVAIVSYFLWGARP
jgi:NADH-quinone oxidoreductase subunit L